MKNILPLIEDLSFKYASNTDIPMMLIFNNFSEYSYAFLENFIDTVTFHDDSCEARNINIYQFLPLECFVNSTISHEILRSSNYNIIDLIINNIDHNYYCSIIVDTYYISNYSMYNQSHTSHQLLIYGYDLSEKVFYAMDYFDFKKANISLVSMNELYNSIDRYDLEDYGEPEVKNKIYAKFHYPSTEFLKLDDCMKREACFTTIKQKYLNFIENVPLNSLDYCYFGIQFLDFIGNRIVEENYISAKHFHYIYYHISLTLFKVKTMKNLYFTNDVFLLNEVIETMEVLQTQSRILEMKIIKVLATNKEKLDKINCVNTLNKIKEQYILAIQKFIKKL